MFHSVHQLVANMPICCWVDGVHWVCNLPYKPFLVKLPGVTGTTVTLNSRQVVISFI